MNNPTISGLFDHVTNNHLIECKNTACLTRAQYGNKINELSKAEKQLLRERDIAQSNNKLFVLLSKKDISDDMVHWLSKENILYVCPKNCDYKNSPLGDASALFREGGEFYF
ncbi:hypothetical protein H0X06_02950 [Candidatus Dependentiae bacterium]|nr:hypothetical protein [Candidatus Dependentiae bacterium]